MKILTKLITLFPLLVTSTTLWSYENLPDAGDMPDAIHLRKDCAATNPDLKNCADNMVEMLGWVWGTRNPSSTSPLMIDIGPGEYADFNCRSGGYVTIRGSGRENTVINNSAPTINGGAAVLVNSCTKLAFQDLTINGDDFGIQWWNGGSSTYTNVRVAGGRFGWWDYAPFGGKSLHYWFSSKVESSGDFNEAAALFNYGAEHWFYGGEITFIANNLGGRSGAVVLGNTGNNTPDVHIFGTAVRAIAPPGVALGLPLIGVLVQKGAFHMHGGIINVNASAAADTSLDAFAISNMAIGSQRAVHTNETAFLVNAKGAGSAKRIAGRPGNVGSPYLWSAGANPPSAISVKSGSDQFVENDCSVGGNCNGGGVETHLMIANPAKCGDVDPWFDTQIGQCRNINTP